MTSWSKLAALAGGLALALIAPITAQAATRQVFMGTPPAAAKAFQKIGIDANDFFPHGLTIRVGDSVRFLPVGFHTVDLVPRGQAALPLFTPTGQTVANALDAAGAPFWFNGQPLVGFNPELQTQLFGKTATFNGRTRVNTGLPFGNKLPPATVRFTRVGTYTYLCDVHPGMKGTVRVLPRRRPIPSARANARVVARMVARDFAIGKQLPKATVPSGVVHVGQAGKFGVEYFNFLPGNLTVAAGTTVTFQMSAGSFETHTATTGPGNPMTEPTSYLGTLAASLDSPAPNPAALYPSNPPPTPVDLTPQTHGNGFWNSGAMDNVAATPLAPSSALRFTTPGTYQFYCLIHPFMHGTVTVTG